MPLPKTIDQVIDQLDQIIEAEMAVQSPLAYFATLYREVTIQVKEGIQKGNFEDGERMEKLDVIFASRYLEAYHRYQNGQTTSQCWTIAFAAAKDKGIIILQHLLLGINAHIDLDLGIAAAETAPSADLPALKTDFENINKILYELIPTVQERLGSVSPLLSWFDRLGGMRDEQLAHFGLGLSRQHAWRLATLLAPLPQTSWALIIETTDQATSLLAQHIRRPKTWLARKFIQLIAFFESKDLNKNVKALKPAN
ncbi:MAG: DUF5995 family protein [Bacteroidota bacterium]